MVCDAVRPHVRGAHSQLKISPARAQCRGVHAVCWRPLSMRKPHTADTGPSWSPALRAKKKSLRKTGVRASDLSPLEQIVIYVVEVSIENSFEVLMGKYEQDC